MRDACPPSSGLVLRPKSDGSAEGYLAAMQEHGVEVRGDVANFTDIAPVIQFSDVVVDRADR